MSAIRKSRSKMSQVPLKKNWTYYRQPVRVKTFPLLSFPVGYPDEFFPEKMMMTHRTPSSKLHYESLLTDLIAPGFLQVDDITLFSLLRKDAFSKISKGKGQVIFMAHQTMSASSTFLGSSILHNGFNLKIKNLQQKCVAMLERKTIRNSNSEDIIEVWLGNRKYPAGRIIKPPLINEYTVIGEGGLKRFIIHKAMSATNSIRALNNFKYVIHNAKTMRIVGHIASNNGLKSVGVDFFSEISIMDKVLLLGALYFISARSASGIEKYEEKFRRMKEAKAMENSDDEGSRTDVSVKITRTTTTTVVRRRSTSRGSRLSNKQKVKTVSSSSSSGSENQEDTHIDGDIDNGPETKSKSMQIED